MNAATYKITSWHNQVGFSLGIKDGLTCKNQSVQYTILTDSRRNTNMSINAEQAFQKVLHLQKERKKKERKDT
jgi:hypothetical protein